VGTLIGGNEPTGGVQFSNPITAHTQYGPNFGVHNDEEENADRLEKLNSTWGQTSRDAVLMPPSILSTEQSTPQGVNQ
jgi:hypothetical protein